jgi:DNA-binding transcriptional LysR family regulator
MLGEVEREEFDLAAASRPHLPNSRTIRWIPLFRKPFVLIAPVKSPAKDWREALETHTLLRYDLSSTTGEAVDGFLAQTGSIVGDSLWVDYLDTMIALVAGGLGVAIIPRSPFGEAEGHVREFGFGADTFYRELGVVRRARPPDGGAIADAFIETLLDEVKRERFAEPLR